MITTRSNLDRGRESGVEPGTRRSPLSEYMSLYKYLNRVNVVYSIKHDLRNSMNEGNISL